MSFHGLTCCLWATLMPGPLHLVPIGNPRVAFSMSGAYPYGGSGLVAVAVLPGEQYEVRELDGVGVFHDAIPEPRGCPA